MPPSHALLPWLDVVGLTVFAGSNALADVCLSLGVVGICSVAVGDTAGSGTLWALLTRAPYTSWPIRSNLMSTNAWRVSIEMLPS